MTICAKVPTHLAGSALEFTFFSPTFAWCSRPRAIDGPNKSRPKLKRSKEEINSARACLAENKPHFAFDDSNTTVASLLDSAVDTWPCNINDLSSAFKLVNKTIITHNFRWRGNSCPHTHTHVRLTLKCKTSHTTQMLCEL